MSFTYFSPGWFFGYDIALELSFAVISLMVALFAFRIYRLTSQRYAKLFGISFTLISISYFIQSIFNFLIVTNANQRICDAFRFQSVSLFNILSIYFHIIFMTIGLVVLTYMTLKTEKRRILWLLLAISLPAIFLTETLYMFFLLSTVYLAFISWYYIRNYLRNMQTKTLLVAIAFVFLLFGSMHFIISVNHQVFYVIGHILELFAYLFILWNFYLVRKK